MFKTFSRLVLILFIITTAAVIYMFIGADTDKSGAAKYETEAMSHSVLIGRFLEHIMDERRDRLEIAASISSKEIRKRTLAEYADFVKKHYDIFGGFAVGEMNKNFKVTFSMDYRNGGCALNDLLTGDIRQRLASGLSFIGVVSEKCGTKPSGVVILAFPLIDEAGFAGAVFDIFSVHKNNMTDSFWLSSLTNGQVELVSDNGKLPEDAQLAALMKLKTQSQQSVSDYKGRKAAFYNFYIKDSRFCLIYLSEKVKHFRISTGSSLLDDFSEYILLIPLILLFVFVVVELYNLNRRLGQQVEERTKNLDLMKRRYESLFMTIPEYVVLYAPDGTILEKNRKCEEIESFRHSKNIYGIIMEHEKFRKKVDELRPMSVENFGEFMLMKDPETGMTVSVSSALTETDKGLAVLSAFMDLTEFKSMQNSFYMAQRREAVGTLAAGMAHDFSNILQNISLQYGLAERADNDEKRDKHLENINGLVEGARLYLDGVLKYTKNTDSRKEPRDGGALTASAVDIVRHILPPDISVDYEDHCGGMKIFINESRYIQLIVNLCQNASEAMDKKGVITVRANAAEKKYGRFFELSVRDTGKGIAESEIRNIFKPFYTTKAGKGTGLGLATVKQVVMDTGGMIDVKSAPGEGCEFIILIPESK